jgi:hypothetical protein
MLISNLIAQGNSTLGPITGSDLDNVNPLKIGGGDMSLTTPGGIFSKVLDFSFPIAGAILFVMILWGGFEIVLGATEKKSYDAGKQRITAAVVGFLILFVSYWLVQIMEVVFGVKILN